MSDRDALVYFYEMTQGHPSGWLYETNWETEKRCATWFGIEVDEGAHVKKILLSDNRLIGELHDTTRLKSLVNLHSLYLNSNIIAGQIPEAFGLMSSLHELNLAWNKFTGNIPSAIYTLKELTVLRLDNNLLVGEISPELGNLTNLKLLNLSNNQLHGVVPKVGHRLPNLGVCDFKPGNAALEGVVPATAHEMKEHKEEERVSRPSSRKSSRGSLGGAGRKSTRGSGRKSTIRSPSPKK